MWFPILACEFPQSFEGTYFCSGCRKPLGARSPARCPSLPFFGSKGFPTKICSAEKLILSSQIWRTSSANRNQKDAANRFFLAEGGLSLGLVPLCPILAPLFFLMLSPFGRPGHGDLSVGSKPCAPGEHQNRWQMDVHPPQNGAIDYAPWPSENFGWLETKGKEKTKKSLQWDIGERCSELDPSSSLVMAFCS